MQRSVREYKKPIVRYTNNCIQRSNHLFAENFLKSRTRESSLNNHVPSAKTPKNATTCAFAARDHNAAQEIPTYLLVQCTKPKQMTTWPSRLNDRNRTTKEKIGIRLELNTNCTHHEYGRYICLSMRTEPDRRMYQQVATWPCLKRTHKKCAKWQRYMCIWHPNRLEEIQIGFHYSVTFLTIIEVCRNEQLTSSKPFGVRIDTPKGSRFQSL